MAPMFDSPGDFVTPRAYTEGPIVLSVDPSGDYLAGGTAVTITGLRFRNNADGTAPSVLFGAVAGTSVVVVDASTITVVSPAATESGLVDITVTIGSQSDTLQDAFLYYETTLSEVEPAHAPFGGGTQVEVRGYNIPIGTYRVRFGDTLGTNVVQIDEEHVVVTVPAHAVGFVDVILETSPGGVEVARLANGFQFTLLTRGEDIRRQPGITIHDALNNQPNTCTFSVDGQSNIPVAGEQIDITDSFDGDRLLFSGNVQRVAQEYEDQTDQLVWRATAIDYTWLFNRRRPYGTYANVSASEIVKDLVRRYTSGFTTNFVQSNLAQISMKFDGTRDLATCLTDIGVAIGGGHWYVDYTPDVHFFHVRPLVVRPVSPIRVGPGTALVAAAGAAMPNTQSFDAGYYYFRTTFLYSNGTESSLGPGSQVIGLTGLNQIDLSSIPIGVNPGGGITVVARRIYFLRGGGQLRRGWKITDNVTTTATVFPGMTSTATIVDETHLTVTITTPPPAPPVPVARAVTAPVVVVGAAIPEVRFSLGDWHFTLSAIYANGSESAEGPASNIITFTNHTTGPHFTVLPAFPVVNGVPPIGYHVFAYHHTSIGVMQTGVSYYNPSAQSWATMAYTPTTSPLEPTAPASAPTVTHVDFGVKPRQNTQAAPNFTWPNNDGPYLEDVDLPEDITDDSELLLHDPPVTSDTDLSQIRNRVVVLGGATSVTVDAVAGATEVEVADVSIFNELGGIILVDGRVINYSGPSSLDPGQGSLFLETALPYPVFAGASVRLYLTGEDVDSQNDLGRVELDVNGNPTDGVHEYVVSDTSLLAPQQLYTRLYAELEIFSRPLRTVRYATRDPKTKSGKKVHFNLADPPIVGDFLIQDVTIDQIHDESDQLSPRYTVVATSARFELNDLLLQLFKNDNNAQSPTVATSARGIVETAISGGPNGSFNSISQSISGGASEHRVAYNSNSKSGAGNIGNITVSTGNVSQLSDEGGHWARLTSAIATTVCEMRTGTIVDPIVSMAQCTWVIRTGAVHDNQRIWVGCMNGTSTVNSDTLVNAHACGWRLSSVVGDNMWKPFINSGLGNGIELTGGNRTSNNWTPNTIYTFQMVFAPVGITGAAQLQSGFSVMYFTNGEFVGQLEWATTNVQSLFMGIWSTPQANSLRTVDIRSLSYQVPYSFNPAVDTSAANFGQPGTLTGIH